MPKSNRINWKEFDRLMYKHFYIMTIEKFQSRYMPHVSIKAIDKRAKKLKISFASYF